MQNEYEIKKEMCEIGRRVYNRGMVAANDGNFSVKLNDNEFLCTPTGVSKGFMTPEYICKVDANGNVIQANKGFKPSSEIKMHMRVYKQRPDVICCTCSSFVRNNICYRRDPADTADHAGSSYRFRMCSDREIRYTVYRRDSGRSRRTSAVF